MLAARASRLAYNWTAMKRSVIIFLLIAVLAGLGSGQFTIARFRIAPAITESDRPFKLSRYLAPAEPPTTPFERVHCAEMGNGIRVCKHISHVVTFFAIERDDTVLGKWPASTYNGGTSWFEVLKGDIDGDRDDEIIVANCSGVTNGIGFQYWTISILPDPERHGFKQPLEFSVEEYGAEGTFVKHPGDKYCNILATEWHWNAIKEQKRKDGGLYFVGRWFHYKAGALEPIADRPVLARRYLFGFEGERLRTYEDSKKPLTWLKSRLTKATVIDPLKLLKEVSSVQGQLIDVIEEDKEPEGYVSMKLRIRLHSGQPAIYSYSDEESEKETDTFYRLGNARSGILYPKAYQPANIKGWLIGKRVCIATYKDNYGALRRIIWVN
jgi:hypothetical protein